MPNRCLGIAGFLILLIWMFTAQGEAVDIPVFARAATGNQVGWYPGREGRPLDWDEKYLLSFGVDSLKVADFGFDLEVRAEERFDGFRPAVRTFLLSWERSAHRLELGTKNLALAEGYGFAQRFVAYPSYDSGLFEADRCNFLAYGFKHGNIQTKAALGGNQKSRGIATLDVDLKPFGQEVGTGLRASTSDIHWHSPSLIADMRLKINLGGFSQRADLMMKEVMSYKDRPARHEYGFATEIGYQLSTSTGFAIGGLYENRELAPKSRSEYHASFKHRAGNTVISPGFSSVVADRETENSWDLLVNWQPFRQSDIGFVYRYQMGPLDEIRHVFAVQAALRIDF